MGVRVKDATHIPISVIVMTKNEEKNIEKCMRSLKAFDEVFVVDSRSTDRTCEIAKRQGAKIVEFRWNGKYPKKKQWCLENLPFKNDWVLYVDADEELYPETAEEIGAVIEAGQDCAGYFVGYDYAFIGKILKHGHRVYKLVLFERRRGRFLDYDDLDVANMWEVEGHYQPSIDGKTSVLRNRMLHNDHDDLYHYFDRHNKYSDWEAVLRKKNAIINANESQPFGRLLLKRAFQAMPFKAVIAFLYSFVIKGGFLDGRAGFHFALARGFYYWQIGLKQRRF